jgi:hypothetical protein
MSTEQRLTLEEEWNLARASMKKVNMERWWRFWRWPHRVWHWCKQPTIRGHSCYWDKGSPRLISRRPGKPEKDQPPREVYDDADSYTFRVFGERGTDGLNMDCGDIFPASPSVIPTLNPDKYPTVLTKFQLDLIAGKSKKCTP